MIITAIATPAYAQPDAKASSVKKKAQSNKKKSAPPKKKASPSKKVAPAAALAAPVSVAPGPIIETITPIDEAPAPAVNAVTPAKKSQSSSNKATPPPVVAPVTRQKISNEDIKNANNAIGIQYIQTNVNYKETLPNGSTADTEKGYVPGYAINFSLMKDFLFGNDYIAASYSKNSGNTNYVGAYQGGQYGDVKSSHPAQLQEYSMRYGRGFEITNQAMLTPFIEYGRHQWVRTLNVYQETYKNSYYSAGILGQVSPARKWVLSGSAMLGRTINSSISSTGAWDNPGTSLGNSTIYKVGLGVDYAITREFHGNFNANYSAFKYGQGAVLNGYYEPDSSSKYTTFGAGVSYNY